MALSSSPQTLATETGFMEDQFSSGGKDGFWTIQAHYIYCALYYYYVSSTSDHQVSRGWGPRL